MRPIKIGFISSQSGVGRSLGQTELRSAELCLRRVNSAGGVLGRSVRLVAADDQSDAERARVEVGRVISEGVAAVIGPSIAATSLAIIPAVKESGLPTVLMTPFDYPNLNAEPLIFSPIAVSLEQGLLAMFRYLEQLGVENLGVVYGNDVVGDKVEAVGTELCRAYGIDVTVVRVPRDSSDYTPALVTLRTSGVGAVFVGMTGAASATVRRNQVHLAWDVPLYSHAGNVGSAFLNLLGPAADGMAWWSTAPPVSAELSEGEQKRLIDDIFSSYRKLHGEPSNYLAVGLGFDSLLSLVKAIEVAATEEPAAIRDALENQEVLGINGRARRSPSDHRGTRQDDAYVVEWRDREYHLLS